MRCTLLAFAVGLGCGACGPTTPGAAPFTGVADSSANLADFSVNDFALPATNDLRGADFAIAPLADMRASFVDAATDASVACGAAQLVVNEIQTAGAGGATDEWIELFNPCAGAVTLTSWKLVYRSASSQTDQTCAALTGSIAGGGYYLVANSGYTGTPTPQVKPLANAGLSAVAGSIGLRDPSNNLIDSVAWEDAPNANSDGLGEGSPAAAPQASNSIARTPNGRDTNNNAADFVVASTPTPGASN